MKRGCESCAQSEAEKQSGRDADNLRENSEKNCADGKFFFAGCTGVVTANRLERGCGEDRYADAFL